MNRKEIKAAARAQLGNGIFTTPWLIALVVMLIYGLAVYAINGIPAIGTVAMLILAGPISIGMSYVFLKQARDNQAMELANLGKGFTGDVTNNILLGVMIDIYTFLWTLLFIIPGIVKGYAYSMAYFIKLDHPDYDWKKCIDESKALTNGHKWELFVLDLSFIGWYIVGYLCLAVGMLWVTPYHQAAKTQFYNKLVGKTVDTESAEF